MIKCIVISANVDKSIQEILQFEQELSVHSETQSYSKMVNYLIALGIDRYNDLIKRTGKQITTPEFEFDKYTRHTKPADKEVQS
jgi:hypothetical protein